MKKITPAADDTMIVDSHLVKTSTIVDARLVKQRWLNVDGVTHIFSSC